MCLGIPGKVIELNKNEQWAIIESFGVRNKILTMLVDEDFDIGDYLMVHAGYAIGKIDMNQAQQTLQILKKISEPEQE